MKNAISTMTIVTIVLAFGLTVQAAVITEKLPPQCIDESGEPVDWYIVYKFPHLTHHHSPKLFSGFRYATLTSRSSNEWRLSPHNITDRAQSIFARTLAPITGSDKSDQISAVLYSDQPPEESPELMAVSSTYAHAKGAIVTNAEAGFWLIHSVPKFIIANREYEYVHSGARYGQVALCISLNAKQISGIIVNNLLTARPYVYHSQVSEEADKLGSSSSSSGVNEAIHRLTSKQWSKSGSFVESNLTTAGGVRFRSFHKSPGDHVDLYADIVAKKLNGPLLVETWRRNPGTPLDSECDLPRTRVENVEEISVKFHDSPEHGTFPYTDDHAKWAISGADSSGHQNWVCIGDINRMQSQFKRGGGTTCLAIDSVWKAFYSFVSKIEKCKID